MFWRLPNERLTNEAAQLLVSTGNVVRRPAMVLGHAAMFGVVHEADEGTAVHIFQLLMVAQVPFVAFFAIKWLPRTPRQGPAGTCAARWRRARSDCRRLLSHLASSTATSSHVALTL